MLRDGLERGHLEDGSVDLQLQRLAEKTTIRRIGRPPEIAAMIQFLLDPSKSSFVTGAEFVVDGGALARLSTE
jgi:NAD(P)-dependent dehydrogenase (short-subunit alcohol dehydrogenase family)